MYKKQIDGLRGVLFFVVFTYHHNVNAWFLTYSLPCFFVLSGFLITRILLQGEDQPKGHFLKMFFARRSLRIFPIYWVVVLATWLSGLLFYPAYQALYVFNIKLFLMSLEEHSASLVEVFHNWEHGQIHLWSMGVEEQFYLLYPFTLLFLGRRGRIPVLLALIAASMGLRHWFATHYPLALYGALLPICGEYILWGCVAATLQHHRFNWGPRWLALYGAVVGLAAMSLLPEPESMTGFFQFIPSPRQTPFGVLLALLIVGLWNDDDALLSRFLRFPVLTYVGKMSYGLYLMHMAMWDLAAWLKDAVPLLEPVGDYFLRLALVLTLGSISWYGFELPLNKLKRLFPVPGAAAR